MRNKLLQGLFLALATLSLANCGKSDSGGGGTTATTPITATTCTAGQVYHSTYGCLPTGSCPANYGMYQNQCIFIGTNQVGQSCNTGSIYSPVYGCLPQGSCQMGYGFYNNQCILIGQQYPVNTTINCGGSCPVGLTQTPFGCIPQAGCPACMGRLNGMCVQGYISQGNYYGFPNYYNGGIYINWTPRPYGNGWGGWGQGGWGGGWAFGWRGGW